MNNWTERILKLEYQVEKLQSSMLSETKVVTIATEVVKTCQRSIEEIENDVMSLQTRVDNISGDLATQLDIKLRKH